MADLLLFANNTETLEPIITFQFPESPASIDDDTTKAAILFCFPEEEDFRKSILHIRYFNLSNYIVLRNITEIKLHFRETFSFTLTKGDGSKCYGYCRRFLADGIPECYCLLSYL